MAATDIRIASPSLAAKALARMRASNAWLGVHMPFVWRTRVLLYVWLAVMASAWFSHSSRVVVSRTSTATTLSEVELNANLWTFFTMGFVALFCFDVARRTGPVFAVGHRARLCLCVAVAVAAIQLPQLLAFRSVIPRIARLDTEPNVDEILKRHGPYRFWRCFEQQFEVPKSLSNDVRQDLARYGLVTHLRAIRVPAWAYCRDRPEFQNSPRRDAWSLMVWQPPPNKRFYNMDDGRMFEEQLKSIKAAHQFMRGEGRYATMLDVRRPLAVASLASILTTLFVSLPLVRARVFANRRRFAVPLRGRLRRPSDEWIARRWPRVWVSRVAAAPLSLLSVPLVLYWMGTSVRESTTLFHYGVAVFATLIFLGTQRGVRYIPATTRQEAIVLAVHAVALLAMLVLADMIFDRDVEKFRDGMARDAITWAILCCAGLQAARIGSIYTAFGAMGVVFASFTPTAILTDTGTVSSAEFLVTLSASLAGVMLYAWKYPVKPTPQRVLLGALFIATAVLWIMLGDDLDRRIPDLSNNHTAVVMLLGALGSFLVILRITENRRLSLAHAP
jgi:hypothetical protein